MREIRGQLAVVNSVKASALCAPGRSLWCGCGCLEEDLTVLLALIPIDHSMIGHIREHVVVIRTNIRL